MKEILDITKECLEGLNSLCYLDDNEYKFLLTIRGGKNIFDYSPKKGFNMISNDDFMEEFRIANLRNSISYCSTVSYQPQYMDIKDISSHSLV